MYWRKKRVSALIKILITCILVLSGMYSLGKVWKSDTDIASYEVENYLQEALNLMEENFLYSDRVNWEFVKQKAHTQIDKGASFESVYPGIKLALSLIEDNHSFFMPPDKVQVVEKDDHLDLAKPPSYSLIKEDIGYLALFSLDSISGVVSKKYAQQIQAAIQELDRAGLDKWVVDLRNDTGGNMWPMLLGNRPLLGEGLIGFFIGKDGEKIGWYNENGNIKVGECVLVNISDPYLLKTYPRIAVLLGERTASAGEAVAIAFSGKQNVRFFGQKTAGYTSCNELYKLKDGACIALTTGLFANRMGKSFLGGMTPDEEISLTEGKDLTIEAAIQWLYEREKDTINSSLNKDSFLSP